jgi:hypothetical protein
MRISMSFRIVVCAMLLTFDATIASAASPRLKDYYVSPTGWDQNDGSLRKPWATITQAARRVLPGSTVHVAAGTYTAPVTTEVSGLPTARIRFVSDKPWAARIVIVSRTPFAWINTGSFVDIEDFEVTGDAANGIYSLGAFSRITGNHVHNLVASCDGNGGSGINLPAGAHHSTVARNVVHDIRALATCDKSHGVGIYVQTTADAVNHNLVYGNGNQGIQMWHGASDGLIAHNTVFSNGKEGILIGCGDSGCEPRSGARNDNTIVANNISVYNAAGVREYGSTGKNNIYRNNLFYGNQRDVILQNGIIPSGTVQANPSNVFVNWQPDGSGDYHLKPDSAAIHAGTTQRFPAPFESVDALPAIGADCSRLARTR